MPDQVLPEADWLAEAIRDINRIPENTPREIAVNKMARRIVRLVEIDNIPSPRILRDKSNCVHIQFLRKSSEIEFIVSRPDSFRADGRSHDGKAWSTCYGMIASRDYAEYVRLALGWLYQERNATSAEGMVEEVEVARR